MSTSTISTASPAPFFPVLSTEQDSKYYSVEMEDVAVVSDTDGGYIVSRARTTKPPRTKFTSGFTAISNADMQLLQAFYASVQGGSVIFGWNDPISATTYQVRFMDKKLNFKYTGVGFSSLWDVQFTLQSV